MWRKHSSTLTFTPRAQTWRLPCLLCVWSAILFWYCWSLTHPWNVSSSVWCFSSLSSSCPSHVNSFSFVCLFPSLCSLIISVSLSFIFGSWFFYISSTQAFSYYFHSDDSLTFIAYAGFSPEFQADGLTHLDFIYFRFNLPPIPSIPAPLLLFLTSGSVTNIHPGIQIWNPGLVSLNCYKSFHAPTHSPCKKLRIPRVHQDSLVDIASFFSPASLCPQPHHFSSITELEMVFQTHRAASFLLHGFHFLRSLCFHLTWLSPLRSSRLCKACIPLESFVWSSRVTPCLPSTPRTLTCIIASNMFTCVSPLNWKVFWGRNFSHLSVFIPSIALRPY